MFLVKAKLESQTTRSHQDERCLKKIGQLTRKFGVKTTREYWVIRLKKETGDLSKQEEELSACARGRTWTTKCG
jgi:hypothetical protein